MKRQLIVGIVFCAIAGTAMGISAQWDPNEDGSNVDMLDATNWNNDPAGATGHAIGEIAGLAAVLDGDWNYNKSLFIGIDDPGELVMLSGTLNVSGLEIGGDYWNRKDEFDNTVGYGSLGIMTVESGTVDASRLIVGQGNSGFLTINGGTVNAGAFAVVGAESNDRLLVSDGGPTGYYIPFSGQGTIKMTGGTLNFEHMNVGRDESSVGNVYLSGSAQLVAFDDDSVYPEDAYFRIGDPQAATNLVIEGGARLRAGSISLLTPTHLEFVLDANSLSNSRIDVYDYDDGDTFELDPNHVTIGADINLSFVDEPIANTPFDIVSSVTDLNEEEGLVDNISQESADAGWSLAIVSDGNGGTILQATYSPTFANCDEVIEAGFARTGDFDQDCDVDVADFAKIAENWMKTNDPEDPDFNPNW
jgi:hypothetical protein